MATAPNSPAPSTPNNLFILSQPRKNIPKHKDVMVILVGWIGCSYEYLKKYVHWYNGHGFLTLATTPPGNHHLFYFY